jgi:hypothetical protein
MVIRHERPTVVHVPAFAAQAALEETDIDFISAAATVGFLTRAGDPKIFRWGTVVARLVAEGDCVNTLEAAAGRIQVQKSQTVNCQDDREKFK